MDFFWLEITTKHRQVHSVSFECGLSASVTMLLLSQQDGNRFWNFDICLNLHLHDSRLDTSKNSYKYEADSSKFNLKGEK